MNTHIYDCLRAPTAYQALQGYRWLNDDFGDTDISVRMRKKTDNHSVPHENNQQSAFTFRV